MIKFLPPIIKEFFRALAKGYTYNIFKNVYAIFGILWGIPVPLVTISIGLYFSKLSPSLVNIISHIKDYPVYLFFLLHPIMFGIVFGAMGTVREEKERQRSDFENSILLMNEELKKMNQKLKELDTLKDNFLSMVSHELLSPLTTIQGYISFLKQGKAGELQDKQIEALNISEEETGRLKYLIEELMDLSKIEAGKFEVRLAPTDIKKVVNKVKNTLRPLLEEKLLELDDNLPEELPFVFADAERMSQVFSNLIGNAIKFTPPGGRITISTEVTDEKIIFCIEDTGIGVPKDEIERIFDRFYQIDSTGSRKFGGCGLGLTISKNIIELHKGKIWVENKKAGGSRFYFELKRYDKILKTDKNFSKVA